LQDRVADGFIFCNFQSGLAFYGKSNAIFFIAVCAFWKRVLVVFYQKIRSKILCHFSQNAAMQRLTLVPP
jgi:hypothetical protein